MSTAKMNSAKWRDFSNSDRNKTCVPSQTSPFKIRYQPEDRNEINLTSYRLKTPLDAQPAKTCAQALGAKKGDYCIVRCRGEGIIDRDNQDGTFKVHFIDTSSKSDVRVEDITVPQVSNHKWSKRGPQRMEIYADAEPGKIESLLYSNNTDWGQLVISVKKTLGISHLAQIHLVQYGFDEAGRQIEIELKSMRDVTDNASVEVRIGRAETAFATFNVRQKPGLRNEPKRGWQDQPEWRQRTIQKIGEEGHWVDKRLKDKADSVAALKLKNERKQAQLHRPLSETVQRFRPMWLEETVRTETQRQQYTAYATMQHSMMMDSMIPARTNLVEDPQRLLEEVRGSTDNLALTNTQFSQSQTQFGKSGTYNIPTPWGQSFD
jgi:hypothetical protein